MVGVRVVMGESRSQGSDEGPDRTGHGSGKRNFAVLGIVGSRVAAAWVAGRGVDGRRAPGSGLAAKAVAARKR